VTSMIESLDLRQGFKFEATSRSAYGYLLTATLFGTTLAPDIQGFNAEAQKPEAVVGVLSSNAWAGGGGDPISLEAYLSAQNHQRVSSLLQGPLSTFGVTFNFASFGYDPVARRWCRRFYPVTPPLQGAVQRSGARELRITLDLPPWQAAGVQAWGMSVSIMPAVMQQTLACATSCQNRVVRPWGITPRQL
jgi:hypothetical protein